MTSKELDGYDEYYNLANAIITQAAKDYLEYKQRLYAIETGKRTTVNNMENYYVSEIKKIKRFFNSVWYSTLTKVPSALILEEQDRKFQEWVDKHS